MNGYVKVQDAYEAICDAFKYDTGIDREAIKAALSTVNSTDVIPTEWIEKQKSECFPHSITWTFLDELLRDWKKGGN